MFNSISKWLWRGLMVPVVAGGLLLTSPAQVTEAAETQKTCRVYTNDAWSRGRQLTLNNCAVTVGATGAKAGQAEVRGQWGTQEFVVQSSGKVIWTATGRSAGTLPDLDQDAILYDACPQEAENTNNVFDTDGCPDTLQDLMDLAEADIDNFWAQNVNGYQSPSTVKPYTRQSPVRTACGRSIPNNAFYCRGDEGIYYDYRFLERMLRLGDFGPVAVLAHEWGHFMQDQMNLRNRYSIEQELQADCFAGAYTGYLASGQSTLARIEEGDAEEGAQLLYQMGDPNGTPWYDEDAHGTADQRYEAFVLGLNDGLNACLDM